MDIKTKLNPLISKVSPYGEAAKSLVGQLAEKVTENVRVLPQLAKSETLPKYLKKGGGSVCVLGFAVAGIGLMNFALMPPLGLIVMPIGLTILGAGIGIGATGWALDIKYQWSDLTPRTHRRH